jgi:glycolate oxidase iron-sulfur subunit
MNDRVLDDLLKCVRCGSCKALCPTYGYDASEPMSPRGRLVLLAGLYQGHLKPSPLLIERIASCSLCGICESLCPAGVDVTEAIYRGRSRLRPADGKRRRLRAALGFALRKPRLSFRAARLMRPLLPYIARKADLPFELRLPEEPLRNGERVFKPQRSRGRVALFTGCSVNFLFPELGESLINVLYHLGFEVVLPPGEVCCGAPLRALGLEKEAVELAAKNMEIFGKLRAEAILSLCPTCTLATRVQYPKLIGQGMENAMDVSEFLAGRLRGVSLKKPGRVLYHDPCHLGHGLGVREQPRRILRGLGLEVLEPPEQGCCGFSLSLTEREVSAGLLAGRLQEYREADTVVAPCPGCMMQLARGRKRVLHIIELIDEAMEQEEAPPPERL